MIKYEFRNSAEYFNFIDELRDLYNQLCVVTNDQLLKRTVDYIYNKTSGFRPHISFAFYYWTCDDLKKVYASPVTIGKDGSVILEMPPARCRDGYSRVRESEFGRRNLAEKLIVNPLKEWCDNQGYIMRMVKYGPDHVEFAIDYMGRSEYYHLVTNQLDYVNDAKKRVESVMEHFENNYGKRAEFAEALHLPVDIVREVTKTYEGGRRNMAKRLQNSIYGMVTGSIPMPNEVRETLKYFKEVNDSMFKRIPDITKVIHNDPATIVFWSDGTKTVVKAENEAYDPEKGIAMAITKKVLGNKGNYYNTIRKWLPKEEE